jgi:capsular polysaccharide transport system permease protein
VGRQKELTGSSRISGENFMTSLAVFAEEVRRGARQQADVVYALLFKDFHVRSNAGRLGMFWTVCSPIINALVLGSFWTFTGRKEFYGVSPFLVMTASIIPYQLVRRGLGAIPAALGSNTGLYGYPQVKPIDALLARYIFESMLTMLGGGILFLGLWWFADLKPSFPDPLGVLGVCGLVFMTTMGVSLIVGVYSILSDTFDRVLGFLHRPLIFISLVLHLGNQLPPQARYWASWNPLADINEYLRLYTLGIPKMPEASLGYPAFVGLLALAYGLVLYYANRRRILQQT